MANDYKVTFDKVFDDSCRLIMAIISGIGGVELQIFDRDVDTENPAMTFLLTDEDLNNFLVTHNARQSGILWSAGLTNADLENHRETGEALPGVRIGL